MNSYLEKVLHEFDLPLQNPVLVFSVLLFIILLSPVILRRFNIPAIIGLIISGVIVGPYGFNILEKTTAIELFSTIGLLYIMFIAGLEFNLNEFKHNKSHSITFGLMTFIVPFFLGFITGKYLMHFNIGASLLTAALLSTHTLVSYPIVSRLGIAKSRIVSLTVGGTIIADTLVLLILAVIIAESKGTLTTDYLVQLGISLSIFFVVMFWAFPKFSRWFFQRVQNEKYTHYIFVLSMVFLAAFIAQMAGMEGIIGAFMAGLALNRLIPHSSALMNRIDFIGNSLFIPVFLISVGMLVDIKYIFTGLNTLIAFAILTSVGVFSKFIAALGTQWIFKFNASDRNLIFGLSTSRAAATLVIALLGKEAGLFNENIFNGVILLILATSIISSFITEKTAKTIVAQSIVSDETSKNIDLVNEHILLPIANPNNLEKLLDFCILIKDKKSVNPISILSVVANDHNSEQNIRTAKKALDKYAQQASASETQLNIITTIDSDTISGIIRISREIMSDILVFGWPNRPNVVDRLVGEKINSLISNTDRTTFVVSMERSPQSHRRMLLFAPPMAEHEIGFHHWLNKILKIVQELSCQLMVFSNEMVFNTLNNSTKKIHKGLTIKHINFEHWDDFLMLSSHFKETDLLVLVSARKNSASYINQLEGLPSKIEKHFPENSRIVVFPQLYDRCNINPNYEDISAEPLIKGIETVQKIGKGIGQIFKS